MELGCDHYERNCKFIVSNAPCCRRIYSCRFCHDDKEDHAINRHEVDTLICAKCSTVQSVKLECEHCGVRFGKYGCLKCRLFDNEEKGQFHCEECGICRIGGKQNYFHCEKCNICLPKNSINGHKRKPLI
ncbi:hypothetical protein J437_LFUL016875 [Ladona fulva]|uniref:CHY-type domain-containing protein n=1 Tax=Ladona fulva TaxID=123851 RepID=A0A8K0P913_LADFU|nr:hypothetical protein J437_LFUL016875 [Ladona fulva]